MSLGWLTEVSTPRAPPAHVRLVPSFFAPRGSASCPEHSIVSASLRRDLHPSLLGFEGPAPAGARAQSSLMPKRAKEIEHVSKASMVDLRAQLYRSEETLKQSDGTAAAAAEQERRRRERRTDVLGAGRNRGVESRAGTDDAHEAGMAQRAEESMQRKVEAYEAMARGDCAESSNSLVDFEMKQLRAPPPRNAPGPPGPPGPPSLLSADMAREAERVRWEEEAGAQTRRPEGSLSAGLQRYEQRSSMLEKRLLSEMAEETETGRATASEQKHKRQRALEERRAMLRLRQESRRRADEEQKAAAAAAATAAAAPARARQRRSRRLDIDCRRRRLARALLAAQPENHRDADRRAVRPSRGRGPCVDRRLRRDYDAGDGAASGLHLGLPRGGRAAGAAGGRGGRARRQGQRRVAALQPVRPQVDERPHARGDGARAPSRTYVPRTHQ